MAMDNIKDFLVFPTAVSSSGGRFIKQFIQTYKIGPILLVFSRLNSLKLILSPLKAQISVNIIHIGTKIMLNFSKLCIPFFTTGIHRQRQRIDKTGSFGIKLRLCQIKSKTAKSEQKDTKEENNKAKLTAFFLSKSLSLSPSSPPFLFPK